MFALLHRGPVFPAQGERRTGAGWALILACIYLAVQLFFIQHHEMWRDELQAWLLARDSESIPALFQNMRYEGHPALWHLLLMPLTRIFPAPGAMQALHVLLATVTIYLLLRYAPFGWAAKLLLSCSYYLAYEYSQISRNYGVAVLLIFAFCAVFENRRRRMIELSLILFLLAQTNVLGVIMVLALSAALFTERLLESRRRVDARPASLRDLAAAAIIIAGVVLSVLQMHPPADSGFAAEWTITLQEGRLWRTLQALAGGYLPLPAADLHYWNSLLLASSKRSLLLSLVAIALAVLILGRFMWSSPPALLAFLLASVGMLVFFYVKYPGSLRHHGFLFIALIASLWIAPFCEGWRRAPPLPKPWRAAAGVAMLGLLSVQAAAGVTALTLDYRYTFSSASRAAAKLAAVAREGDTIIATPDAAASAVMGYLHVKAFYLESQEFGSFVRWDNKRTRRPDLAIPQRFVEALDGRRKLFLVVNRRLDFTGGGVSISEIFASNRSIVRDENFFIYEFSK